MPDISLECRAVDYLTDLQEPVTVWRSFVHAQFVTTSPRILPSRACLIDTGAPWGVIPHSLSKGLKLAAHTLGTTIIPAGRPATRALDWFGVPCELRAVDVYLVDPNTQIQTGPHVLVAKWALKPHVGELKKLENVLVFGMSFLTDNHISMVLQGAGATMTGYLSVADP